MTPKSVVKVLNVRQPATLHSQYETQMTYRDGKPTLLLVTEVKCDFQAKGKKNHESHQRDPEPKPQGHRSPTSGDFVTLDD
jgi:hypothetical protein